MSRPTLISNEQQIVDWIAEGRTYRDIVDLYEMAFGRRLSQSTINNVRKRNSMPPRINRDDRLIPWAVESQHRNSLDIVCLRTESRMRRGLTVNEQHYDSWRAWRKTLEEGDLVVDYDPARGFSRVPRRKGIDLDLIREPKVRKGRSSYQ